MHEFAFNVNYCVEILRYFPIEAIENTLSFPLMQNIISGHSGLLCGTPPLFLGKKKILFLLHYQKSSDFHKNSYWWTLRLQLRCSLLYGLNYMPLVTYTSKVYCFHCNLRVCFVIGSRFCLSKSKYMHMVKGYFAPLLTLQNSLCLHIKASKRAQFTRNKLFVGACGMAMVKLIKLCRSVFTTFWNLWKVIVNSRNKCW